MSILSPIGKINRLFGLDGGVQANLYDTFPGDIDTEEPLFVRIDELAVPLFVDHFQRRGQQGALFRFADIDSAARAGQLLGLEIFIRTGEQAADCDEDDGLFLEDLVGYRATVHEGKAILLGTVGGFIDSELNPLLRIDSDGRELLIPAADEFIASIDPDAGEISFTVPEGLLDLNG